MAFGAQLALGPWFLSGHEDHSLLFGFGALSILFAATLLTFVSVTESGFYVAPFLVDFVSYAAFAFVVASLFWLISTRAAGAHRSEIPGAGP
ncbi:MAG TPA: hypothetical protein VMS77_09245 [Conexivisphaerales archaeon]|nr:hypothetical protein [Conexivisphaerales archaeon]